MEQVEYYGLAKMPRDRVNAIDVALSVSAVDYAWDDRRSKDFDVGVNDGFETYFPPVVPHRVLSGLWTAVAGNVPYASVEYHEPNAQVRYRQFGALIASQRGIVEAAAEILKHVVRGNDEVLLWWAELCGDPRTARHGSIRITADQVDHFTPDEEVFRINGEHTVLPATIRRLLEDRRSMFEMLSAVAK